MAVNTDPKLIGLVFAGGVVGTAARAGLGTAFPTEGWPWATFVVNLSGALLLGLLLETLAKRGPDEGMQRQLRLFLGTGLLGSYTTYSTFAVETVSAQPWIGLGYAVAGVVLGVVAAWCGTRLAGWWGR